jgi:hypothetical protein
MTSDGNPSESDLAFPDLCLNCTEESLLRGGWKGFQPVFESLVAPCGFAMSKNGWIATELTQLGV